MNKVNKEIPLIWTQIKYIKTNQNAPILKVKSWLLVQNFQIRDFFQSFPFKTTMLKGPKNLLKLISQLLYSKGSITTNFGLYKTLL